MLELSEIGLWFHGSKVLVDEMNQALSKVRLIENN